MKPHSGSFMNGASAQTRKEVIYLQEKKDLKAKRNAFCCYYVLLGNVAEAAEKNKTEE